MPLPVDSGLMLQLDCPDLAMGRHHAYAKLSEQEFLGLAAANVAALNAATEGLPAERLRCGVVWCGFPAERLRCGVVWFSGRETQVWCGLPAERLGTDNLCMWGFQAILVTGLDNGGKCRQL